MDKTKITNASMVVPVVKEIKVILDTARNNVAQQVNNELLFAYWNIGRIICEYEQAEATRADYGKQTLRLLSKELTREFGKGFRYPIYSLCAAFIRTIKFNRQRLLN